ncbi:MAG: hypothetical protein J5736_04910 [Bacilli bacterium]|nr:hypothetical protein [Bacilli bacterium]
MKDKLQKTNHRKAYYRFRAFGIGFLLVLGGLALCSIPVIVSYTSTVSVTAKEEAIVIPLPKVSERTFQILEYQN